MSNTKTTGDTSMQVAIIEMTKDAARTQLHRYQRSLQARRRNEEKAVVERIDAEDRATVEMLKVLAEGRQILDVVESMRLAGCKPDGTPVLAIARADQEWCYCRSCHPDLLFGPRNHKRAHKRLTAVIPKSALPGCKVGSASLYEIRAVVPTIPPHLRPAASLRHFHILWEADWQAVPRDPILLRRIRGHQYAVIAQWDLTEVERLVLSTRLHAASN
jgi:hypothetical protein